MIQTPIMIPADVPSKMHDAYTRRYTAITGLNKRLMLFSCDHKLEHLNEDFYGNTIHPDVSSPAHLFKIAAAGEIGAFASQLGLIARYGKQYPALNYIIKLNGKTNLIDAALDDPYSAPLWTTQDVVSFEQSSGLSICGVGITLYMGSMYEAAMLEYAAQEIYNAHQQGYVAILWAYPRGHSVANLDPARLLEGAAGIAPALGADFVKIEAPILPQELRIATMAAGNTKVICAGGEPQNPGLFLHNLYEQIHIGGAEGCAIGRMIFQQSEENAIAMTRALSAIVFHDKTASEAHALYTNTHTETEKK
jgi:DhnA family fructose-bisphosphate aldolase class Ia